MPNPGTNAQVASVARECAAHQNSQEFRHLSSLMCWDAVVHVMNLAGVDVSDISVVSGTNQNLVSTANTNLASAAAVQNLPEGHIIGFFDGKQLIHAMVSTGAGNAAGNKNSCLGIGNPVGWEVLDIGHLLNWAGGQVVLGNGARYLAVYERSCT